MFLLARRTMMAHKVRMLLTALSIVFGVGFVSGTYVFTDGINSAFTELFTSTNKGIDIIVRRQATADNRQRATQQSQISDVDPNSLRIAPEVLATVEQVPGVAAAEPLIAGSAQLVDAKGKLIGGGGPPTLGFSWSDNSGLAQVKLVKGRAPKAADEVVIDEGALKRSGAKVGDTVGAVFGGGRRDGKFRIVGVVRFGASNALQGATLSFFTLDASKTLFDTKGGYDSIYAKVKKGESKTLVRDRVAAVLPKGYQAITGSQSTKENLEGVAKALSFLRYITLGFAAIALFVATFTIFNTFTITIAQRLRELGLLRAVGSTRQQILNLVLIEGFTIGLFASIAGVALGVAISSALHWGLNANDITIPDAPLTLAPRTVVISLIVGVGITMLAALVPAWRASTVSPMEAIRAGATEHHRRRAMRFVSWFFKVLTLVGGIVLLYLGLTTSSNGITSTLSLIGAGFALLIVGMTLVGPIFVRPVVAVIGWPIRRVGVQGELASRNSTRNARRTVTTAAALMIGLGLASFAVIITSSLQATFARTIDRTLGADLTLTNVASTGGPAFLKPAIAEQVSQIDGVKSSVGMRLDTTRFKGNDQFTVVAASGDRIDEALKLTMLSGSDRVGGVDGVLVSNKFAKKHDLKVGSQAPVVFPGRKVKKTLVVRGIYDTPSLSDAVISYSLWPKAYPENKQLDFRVFVNLDDGASAKQVRARIEQEFKKSAPYVRVQDATDIKKQTAKQINQLLGLVFGLLAMSILIALFGIVNTLALSVFERTREIGLLRAVGALRGQIAVMVLGEGVLVSIIGALLGMVLGLSLGAAGVYALKSQGVVLSIPVALIGWLLLIGALVGMLAAALPAWRAARLKVLDAIGAE